MKIKTRLFLSAFFLLFIVSAIGVTTFVATQWADKAIQKGIVADVLVRDVFELNTITDDYFLHPEKRAETQWLNKQKATGELLITTHTSDQDTKNSFEMINTTLTNSKNTFMLLTTAMQSSNSAKLQERLIGKLQVNAQTMVHVATDISSSALKEREAIRKFSDTLILLLIVLIAIAIFVTLSLFYKSVVEPITTLAVVVQKVKEGDLTTRAVVSSKDEVGDFAEALNSMLDALNASHQELEQKVKERTQDLESFTYSVSHDLRAPLRAIDGFSQILEEDYAAKFDTQGKSVIQTIRKSTKQMGELIDDLLTFSRLGRQPVTMQPVDMTSLAQTVFAELQRLDPLRKITFTCEVLPPTQADPVLIKQVWVNFLSNAIKYTKKKPEAIIHVGSIDKGNDIIYYVKDNGAGFDMKYVNKLFGVFQRLHDRNEFEGTGVGLAIVARIVTKHGGRVWAQGVVNEGSTFSFSLPKFVAKK